MEEIVVRIIDTTKIYYGYNTYFLLVMVSSFFYLLMSNIELRHKIIYPTLAILFCIINPLGHKLLFERMQFWRMFWMIPGTVLISFTFVCIIKKIKGNSKKNVIFLMLVFMICFVGSNCYESNDFTAISNWEKTSITTKRVCDRLVELSDNPKAIVAQRLLTEIRQYDGDIQLLYGRNANGYISSIEAEEYEVFRQLESEYPNYKYIFEKANETECNFVVAYDMKRTTQEILDRYGFKIDQVVDEFVIYTNLKE